MGKKKNKGFSLVEVIVVMVIIAVLSIISVPMYRISTRKAMAEEGQVLVKAVAEGLKIFYADDLEYITIAAGTNFAPALGVDARANRYFGTFQGTVGGGNQTFQVITTGVGDALGITVTYNSDPDVNNLVDTEPAITVTGL